MKSYSMFIIVLRRPETPLFMHTVSEWVEKELVNNTNGTYGTVQSS